MKIIILLGQRVRSGTYFIGVTLHQHPDVVCIPPNTSAGEMNLFKDDFIKSHIYKNMTRSFGLGLSQEDFPKFIKLYGELWLNFLCEKHEIPKNKIIFIKSPDIDQVVLWRMAFPDSQIALLCRDGRDNVISSIKASNDKRRWHSSLLSTKKRINYFSGRYFINHTKDWKRTARIYLDTDENTQLKKFRYEDINESITGIENLLKFYNLRIDQEIINKCLQAPVVGSSFGVNKKRMIKPNWKPDFDKEKFIFSGKWHKWNFIQKYLFKIIAGAELVQLDYVADNKW